eukprot:scaffold175784_cov32-Tisochrysis_lutea.AAC.5
MLRDMERACAGTAARVISLPAGSDLNAMGDSETAGVPAADECDEIEALRRTTALAITLQENARCAGPAAASTPRATMVVSVPRG